MPSRMKWNQVSIRISSSAISSSRGKVSAKVVGLRRYWIMVVTPPASALTVSVSQISS